MIAFLKICFIDIGLWIAGLINCLYNKLYFFAPRVFDFLMNSQRQDSNTQTLASVSLEHHSGHTEVLLKGSWRLSNIQQLSDSLTSAISKHKHTAKLSRWVLNGRDLEEIDTAGAMKLLRAIAVDVEAKDKVELINFSPKQANILEITAKALSKPVSLVSTQNLPLLGRLGKDTLALISTTKEVFHFIGHALVETISAIRRPRNFRFREFCIQLENCGYNAIPIVLLVTFLIGIVIAYLTGIQIERYGANIFIVDGVGLAVCRELSPILVAIIVAGRSGSAFTAQIGTMKLNEEVDAMISLGLPPMRVLVIPRIFALMVVMPLLVFAGDVAGIAGGMVVADLRLGVTGATFIERLHAVLIPRSVFVGLVKAPVFAFFIAAIGCRLGLAVENNARSIGTNTTRTVVESIVAVILLNAAFAVIFSELRI